MSEMTVERSIWIAAPRARVWQAVTDPEQIAQWLLPPMLGAQMSRDDGGTLSVLMGPMAVPVAMLEIVEAPRQAISRSLPEKQLATTYTLAEENDGTRVTVTMSGFEALPRAAAQERLAPSGQGWAKALLNLKAYVEGAELPHPEGFVTMLYGFRREAAQAVSIERTIWIKAPRERVWAAITDPAQIQRWFSPNTPWRQDKAGVGGRLAPYDPETGKDITAEIVDVFDPPSRYVTHTDAEAPSVPHVSTWTLTEENGGTRLTLTYSGYELDPEEMRHSSMEQHAFGFGMMLDNLRAYLEQTELPYPFGF
jgi:uncharacterized protein YndB with AHSA1/START domain